MKTQFLILLMFLVVLPCLCAGKRLQLGTTFNVVDYGAKGDGKTDDSKAFVKAWQATCGATQEAPTLIVPKGKIFMLQPVSFKGPCKPSTLNVKLQGTIVAPKKSKAWKWPNNDKDKWVQFSEISGLVINGGGIVNGQGASWWGCEECDRPTALHFHACQNLRLSRLTHFNSPRNQISINSCNDSRISSLHINAPEDSPNTDGIDISHSSNVTITHSIMKTGDDCIAVNSGSSFINISNIYCGPGHGISIGSLGKNGAYDTVEEVHVRNCTFNGTQNGARIKTWVGGSGYARKISFENINIVGAKNPVIIDQQYDPNFYEMEVDDAVQVSDVTYRNVKGTSSSEYAVKLNCDSAKGCSNIVMEGVNITSAIGEKAYVSCKNAQGVCLLCNPSVPCLSDGSNKLYE